MPEGASATPATGSAPVPLASALAGGPTAFVRVDVALDGEPVVGSFTVDGMTFVVTEDGDAVELVGVAPDRQQATSSQEGDGSPVAPMLASGPDGAALAVPESVTCEGVDYAVASIGAYAFYLSGVTSVELPVSIIDVDERAFRSSDVAFIEVDPANESYASFDGILYDASLSRLLLIPGGRMGAARISDKAEEVGAQAFSYCAGVTSISVDAGSRSYSSWEGLLYDASGTTLLRVPAGATDITIRDGCTAIAAGAMEGCAQLTSITAPASVTSVSPDVFTSVPTVSLPAASAADSAPQFIAMVALSSADDGLPIIIPSAVTVGLSEGADGSIWRALGFSILRDSRAASMQSAASYTTTSMTVFSRDHDMTVRYCIVREGGARFPQSTSMVPKGSSKVVSGVQRAVIVEGKGPFLDCPPMSIPYPSYDCESATPGWSISGFTTSANSYNPLQSVEFSTPVNFYACWRAHTYTIAFNANGGTGTLPSNIAATYDQSYTVTPPNLTCSGYTLDGWATSADGAKACEPTGPFKNLTTTDGGSVTLYAQWKANSYTIAFDSRGGSAVSSIGATYDADVTLPTPTRQGYTFKGWDTKADGTGTRYQAGVALTKPNLTATANATVTLYAQWEPTISADVPLEVTARVDLLGIEDQEEATGYIESRCGEPLTVADVAFEPLAGATEFFGAASVADVALEVLAAGSTSPDARFALDVSASQAPASAAAFRMAAYGTKVPISYRFAIPDELLPSLVETEKPVCSVAYTVALA